MNTSGFSSYIRRKFPDVQLHGRQTSSDPVFTEKKPSITMTSTRLFDPAIEICDILSTATSKQIPNRKTTKKRHNQTTQ